MNRQMEEALIEALDLLEQGTPVVKILSRYPDQADELRPYLMTARDLNHLAAPAPTAAKEASKRAFLEGAAAMRQKPRKSAAVWLREIFVSGLAVLFVLFFSGTVMAVSSYEAIPGDALYGTKLFLEQRRLNYSANPEAAAALIEELHQERLEEVKTLLSLDRSEMVTFSGVVEELAQDRWLVEGIPVAVTPSTNLTDEVEIGFLVQVLGETTGGVVVAQQVEVMAGRPSDSDLIDPAPPADPTPMPAIEPLEIPERPQLTLPDDGPETNIPAPAAVPEDDSAGDAGFEDERDAGDAHEGDQTDDHEEPDDGGSDDASNDERDERDEDDDPSGDGDDESNDVGEDGQEDDSGEDGEDKEEDGEGDGDEEDGDGEDESKEKDKDGDDEGKGEDGDGGDEDKEKDDDEEGKGKGDGDPDDEKDPGDEG